MTALARVLQADIAIPDFSSISGAVLNYRGIL